MSAWAYHVISKEKENRIFGHNCIFRHTCNKPNWQSSGIITFLRKPYIVISDTQISSWICFSLRFLYNYQSFMRNQEGRIELRKKIHRQSCVRQITFLAAYPRFYVIFWRFLCLLPSPTQVTYLLNGPYKDT